jgi:hypothetical protein
MVTPALKRQFDARNMHLLGLSEGGRLFVDELFHGMREDVEVVLGAMPEDPGPPALRILVKRDSHPFLDGHRIRNVPVLPVVGALDLFLRATRTERNGHIPFCRELKVLKGIRLTGFENGGDRLIVQRLSGQPGGVEIVSPEGTRYYKAILSADSPLAPSVLTPVGGLEAPPWTLEEVYGRLLFHGPPFQVIRAIEGVSDYGIVGTVSGSREMAWADPHRQCDGAMLDGGLQLARLWGYRTLGLSSLPSSVKAIRILETGEAAGPVRCEVRARQSGPNRFECDIDWITPGATLLATMSGVEMHALPDELV